MNLDTITNERLAKDATITDAVCAAEQVSEITSMPLECFNLVGGGSGIVLLG
jgi:hypothetical protein